MGFSTGDLVTFRDGLYKEEDGLVYRILEVNGDRGIIVLENTDLTIPPQSVALLSDLELVAEDIQVNHA